MLLALIGKFHKTYEFLYFWANYMFPGCSTVERNFLNMGKIFYPTVCKEMAFDPVSLLQESQATEVSSWWHIQFTWSLQSLSTGSVLSDSFWLLVMPFLFSQWGYISYWVLFDYGKLLNNWVDNNNENIIKFYYT